MIEKILLRLFGIKQPNNKNDLSLTNIKHTTSMPVDGVTFEEWNRGEWIKVIGMKIN